MVEREHCITGPLSNRESLEPLLVLENVWQEFPMNDGKKLVVLRDFSLAIKNIKNKPQIVSLLGPSGTGKTTILRIIAGLDKPSRGRILISDGNGDGEKMHQVKVGDVGVVFQKYPLFEDLNVLNNLIEPAVRVNKVSEKEAKDRALRYLDSFGLVAQGFFWPAQLSGGQRQRVAILQQLMADKYFIVLDEPFSGLDPVSISNAISLIASIANQHTLNTFIIVTHDITSALIISDQIYLMGRERDEAGVAIPGTKVVKEYDLISEGLAYRPDVEDIPRFAEIRKEIKMVEFPKL